MQLQPGERSVLAYFANRADAETAIKALRQSGEEEIQLDTITPYAKQSSKLNSSLSYLTGGREDTDLYRSFGPLMAADPGNSGMSIYDSSSSMSYVVTVVTDQVQHDQVIEVLRSYGAII